MKKLILLIFIHLFLLGLSRFIAWPENLLWPYLNFHGLIYYKDIFVLYPPLYWLLLKFVYFLTGISFITLQLYTYIIIAVTDLLLYFAANRRTIPLIIYIPLQIFFEGNGLWVDHLLAPAFLAAYLAFQNKKFFLLGFLLGLSLLIKQTAIYFVAVLFFSAQNRKSLIALIIPLSSLLIFLFATNSLPGFFDSAVKYILFFHARYPLQTQWPSLRQLTITLVIFLPAIYIGLKNRWYLIIAMIIAASLGIFTRFEYFHLQPALPFVAILLSSSIVSLPFILIFSVFFIKFLLSSVHQPPRFFDSPILGNAKIINSYVSPGSRTLFLNTWDHYYYLTRTLPVSNYFVPSAPWTFDYDSIQDKYVNIILQDKPKFIFYNSCFLIKNICYRPRKIEEVIIKNYLERGKLPDGTGIFEYNPVSLPNESEPQQSH